MTTHYITFDDNGNPTGAGSTIDGTIFPGALECTQEQARNWQAYRKENGLLVVDHLNAVSLAKSNQIAALVAEHDRATVLPIEYTTEGGCTEKFSCDDKAISLLKRAVSAGREAWSANVWLSASGKVISPFGFEDAQKLLDKIEQRQFSLHQKLLALISKVDAAKTTKTVQQIAWSD